MYKVYDLGPEGAVDDLNTLAAAFGSLLVTLRQVQFALPHVGHRYMLARSDDALYVAFMGTKQLVDFVTNVNLGQTSIWDGGDDEVRRLHLTDPVCNLAGETAVLMSWTDLHVAVGNRRPPHIAASKPGLAASPLRRSTCKHAGLGFASCSVVSQACFQLSLDESSRQGFVERVSKC